MYPPHLSLHIRYLPSEEIVKLTMNQTMIERVHSLYYILHSKKFSGEIIKCTSSGCNGIIYTNTSDKIYPCNLCNIYTCIDCCHVFDKENQENHENHICDVDTVKSVEYIKMNSKNCPKCNIRISHIDGCNQMFCVYCNTAFNWDTLVIYKTLERYHNPHHQQYIKNHRNINRESDCDINVLEDMISEIHSLIKPNNEYKSYTYLREIIQSIKSTRQTLNSYIRHNPNYIPDLRKKYVTKIIDQNAFLNLYWKHRITLEKNEVLQEISNNMYISMSEIVINLFETQQQQLNVDIHATRLMFVNEFNKQKKNYL